MEISPLIATILARKGIADRSDQERFLHPLYEDVSDPYTLHDMEPAVLRIIRAMDAGEKIAIYADYDADGIPGATVLFDFFRTVQYTNIEVYIPHRHNEGYGMHIPAVDTLRDLGVSVIITVDVGITEVSTIAYAQSLGIDVVLTDHHEPGETLPNAYALVHPKLGSYACPMICGCAVAFQLVRGLCVRLRESDHEYAPRVPPGWEKWLLDLVGLSTIADMVPLVGENRVFAYYGLRVLRKTRRPGIRALCELSRVNCDTITETDLGFRIIPRINAASRMDHPRIAFELLASDDLVRAESLAKRLDGLNEERKKTVVQLVKQARLQMQEQSEHTVSVVGGELWHIGVLGIIAGKMAEEFKKPVAVWTLHSSGILKGSFRGTGNESVLDIFRSVPEGIIDHMGGHADAGGFGIEPDKLELLVEYLSRVLVFEKIIDYEDIEDTPIPVTLDQVNMSIYKQLQLLAPFGVGNREPQFLFENITIVSVAQFGSDRNFVRMEVSDGTGSVIQVISFDGVLNAIQVGESGAIVGVLEYSDFGKPTIRIRALSWKLSV